MPVLYERTTRVFPRERRRTNLRRRIFLLVVLTLVGGILFFVFRATSTIRAVSTAKTINWQQAIGQLPDPAFTPEDDRARTDILVLGLRGESDDEETGRFLTDTIMVVSVDNSSGRSALISIPRDLFVPMPGLQQRHKLNEAYQIGLFEHGNGLAYAKTVVSYVTGLHLDYGAVVDLDAFHELVELTDGVTVTLAEPFTEYKQWYCDEFGENCLAWGIEAGTHRLKGETLDFYIRSRFSSSDFDRARRQQKVLVALKEELLSLGILANPLAVNEMLGTLGRNVKTDATFSEISDLWALFQGAREHQPIRYVYDSSEGGLLEDARVDNAYVLTPKEGNFVPLREVAKEVFGPLDL